MTTRTTFRLVILAVLLVTLGTAPGATPTPAELQALARDLPRPRLLLSEDVRTLRTRLQQDPLLRQARERLLQTAAAMLEEEPVRRVMKGKRMLGSSRLALRRVLHGALAFGLTGDARYAALAKRAMLAAAKFRDWNPSHFLDVGEMCAALAIGYDWLYDDLSADERDRIASALIDKGLRAVPRKAWWLKTTNNWNQVCHGGLTLAALVVWEREPELAAATVHRALERIPHSMHEYAPDGAYGEGPTYWRYGTDYNVLFLEALRSALGTDFGLAELTGFCRSADFYLHSVGSSGRFFNYGDANVKKSWRPSPSMYWFARHLQRPELLWRERSLLVRHLEQPIEAADNDFRFFPLLLLWAPPLTGITAPADTAFTADGVTPVSFQRRTWDDPHAAFFGIKGGSPGHNHAHMDSGSFVYDRFSERWAIDLGKVSYGKVEGHGVNIWDRSQNGGRWKIARHINHYHNTLVVDDRRQRVDGSAPIIAHGHSDGAGHVVLDLAPVYHDCLEEARRGIRLRPSGDLLVQDELRTDSSDRSVRWGMLTRAEVEITTARQARLRQNGQQVVVVIQEPVDANWQVIDTSKPGLDFEPSNPGTRMLAFTHDVPAQTAARLVVHLCTDGDVPAEITPLDDW